jgi:hypothetical protein
LIPASVERLAAFWRNKLRFIEASLSTEKNLRSRSFAT